MPAELVAALYRQRWQIELFFRWIKCILGCRHWLAESPRGVAIEIYLALIAALLLQLYSGRRPNRRMMELIQLYLLGVASHQDLQAGWQRQLLRLQQLHAGTRALPRHFGAANISETSYKNRSKHAGRGK